MNLKQIFYKTLIVKKQFTIEEMNRITEEKTEERKGKDKTHESEFERISEKQEAYLDSTPDMWQKCPFCNSFLDSNMVASSYIRVENTPCFDTYYICDCGYEYALKHHPVYLV